MLLGLGHIAKILSDHLETASGHYQFTSREDCFIMQARLSVAECSLSRSMAGN